ncbi:MAG: hypothetical protein AB7E79_14330 [Rhodospirillaceae bacterium]
MNYALYALAAYLIVGLYLTHLVISSMVRRKWKFRDWILGAFAMPLVILAGLACELWEKAWARLMKILDLEPPEEMRPGPAAPANPKPDAH